MQARDERVAELKREIEALKGENEASKAFAISLKTEIKELESKLANTETTNSKSAITLTAIQRENKEYQTRILELESRNRTHLHEREESERKQDIIYKKLDELASQVSIITGAEIPSTAAGIEKLISKVKIFKQ